MWVCIVWWLLTDVPLCRSHGEWSTVSTLISFELRWKCKYSTCRSVKLFLVSDKLCVSERGECTNPNQPSPPPSHSLFPLPYSRMAQILEDFILLHTRTSLKIMFTPKDQSHPVSHLPTPHHPEFSPKRKLYTATTKNSFFTISHWRWNGSRRVGHEMRVSAPSWLWHSLILH